MNHDDLIGQYCVVRYDSKPYPGRIIEVNESDVKVSCMHCIGNRFDSNRFFWPEKITDECVYAFEDVVTLIPEHQRISDSGRAYKHFRVSADSWAQVERMFV